MINDWYKIEKCSVHNCWKIITYDNDNNKKLVCFHCVLEYHAIQTKNR